MIQSVNFFSVLRVFISVKGGSIYVSVFFTPVLPCVDLLFPQDGAVYVWN